MTKDSFDTLKAHLRRDEGSRLHSYRDQAGTLTIGVGHNIDAHGIEITREHEDRLLEEDTARAILDTVQALPWVSELDEPRQRVVYNMAFNLGLTGLLSFQQTLAAINRRDYVTASNHMLASRWARQVGQRAIRLADTMRTGTDPA